ncbi:MAG: hypothetical protein IJO33_05045 [Bacilli bacterium]|nr:hypothetical protein [Bacilli bacterium]
MQTIEKFKNIINDEEFILYLNKEFRFTDVMAKSITKLLEAKKTSYFPDVFRSLMTLLINTNLSDEEKTEVIAYYINKCMIIFEEDTKENRKIYMTKTAFSSEKKYDMLHANLKRIRTIISSDGEILPCNCKWDINEIASIQMYVPVAKQYIRDILVLSNSRYKKLQKQEFLLKKIALEMKKLIDDITEYKRMISSEEIERAKKNMRTLNYSEEEIATVLSSIEKSNNIILIKQATLKAKDKSVSDGTNYKKQKQLAFELKQYINLENNMPVDYLDEDQITTVSQLINLLGYSVEKVSIILSNIKKSNQDYIEKDIAQFRNDIFAEIDLKEDKNFESLAEDIYSQALQSKTQLSYLNGIITSSINIIDQTIYEMFNGSKEDRDFQIDYIMIALSDIDKSLKQVRDYNMPRIRKESKI